MSITTSEPMAETRVKSVIRTESLCRSIDGRRILCDVSIRIPHGQLTALLGANGAGKSTLMKVLATLTPPTEGKLYLFGMPVDRDSVEVRRRIGFISHGSMLYRDLSAIENLVLFGKLYGVENPEGRAKKLLGFVGLLSRSHDPVKGFSRGMVQRVSIARAMMHDPDLLLADEPFSGLDAPSSRVLEGMLKDLHAMNKSIVLASHDIQQSMELADHVMVLRNGRVTVDSPVREVEPRNVLAQIEAA